MWSYLRGNTDRQQFENDQQNFDVPPGKISADAHEWSCFLACVFRAFTHYELFVSFRSQNKQNQPASWYYFITISCNNKCYAQITMSVAHYSKRQLKTVRSPFQEHRSKPHPSDNTLTCCNKQVTQRYCTMLDTVTGNCDVTNVTYSENKCYVVTWTVYLESSMYLLRRQRLRQIVVMCHIACWFRSGAVLKFDQFYHSSFF